MRGFNTKTKPLNWRSKETHDRYMADIEAGGLKGNCKLCEREPILDFTYCKIVANHFPYDRVAAVHEMIVPKRHTNGSDLTREEHAELDHLKQGILNERYTFIVEGLPNAKSIPAHAHLHLIVPNQA